MYLPRFYPILDTALLEARLSFGPMDADLEEAARVLTGEGTRILQYRHKSFFSRSRFEQARRIAETCRQSDTLFVLNDRSDLARLLSAGVHLGQTDLPPAEARKILGPDLPLGYSTHNEEQLRDAETAPADYLALGPVFATSSKKDPDPVLGLQEFARLAAGCLKPLVAIGGVTLQNAPAVLESGAGSVAVISELFQPAADLQGLRERTREWLSVTR